MACDERYRSWIMQEQEPPPGPELCRARLSWVSRCPARAGYRELYFQVAATSWSWCFPTLAEAYADDEAGVRAVVLRPGPHGLIADGFRGDCDDGAHPARLGLADAARLATSGVPVFVHRSLLGHAAAAEIGFGGRGSVPTAVADDRRSS